MFQDGSLKAIMPAQAPPKHAVPLHINHCIRTKAITLPKEPHSPEPFPVISMNAGLSTRKCTKPRQGWVQADTTDFNRFPFNNFTYCLTLFPKCFSSFPHGTCSLSVSRQYLALEGIYLPFWAAIPNNSTRWERITKHWGVCVKDGILTLYDVPYPGNLYTVQHRKRFSRLQLGQPEDYQILNLSSSRFTRRY